MEFELNGFKKNIKNFGSITLAYIVEACLNELDNREWVFRNDNESD